MNLLLIFTSLLVITNYQLASGYELGCDRQFASPTPQHECTLRNATQYELDSFGVAGIPAGSALDVLNPQFNRFDQGAFIVFQMAKNLTFFKGIVKKIVFQSDSLVSLKVFNSWLVSFEVVEEDNFSLKTLSIRSRHLREISPTIRYLKGLKEIQFQKCSVEFVNLDIFAGMEALQSLDLSTNRIHSVRTDIQFPLMALVSFDISSNNLTELQNFPLIFPSLKFVTLTRNPWFCDWVGEARSNIWNGGITVMGADSFCTEKGMTNNGGLCCKDRPEKRVLVIEEWNSDRGNVETVQIITNENEQFAELTLGAANETNPQVLLYTTE